MSRVAALALALAALVVPAVPDAEACGGGGDGDDSSSASSSSDSSSSDGGSSAAATPACVDTTDIHGYRECTRYGGWGALVAPVSIELATTTTQLSLAGVQVDGEVSHDTGNHYAYRVVGEDLGAARTTAVGLSARILGHRRRLYAGVEAGFAGLTGEAAARMDTVAGATLTPRASLLVTGGAVVGARTFVGRLGLGAELLAGVRALGVTSESRDDACVTTDTAFDVGGLLEARARAEVWMSPWLSAAAYVGANLQTPDRSVGLVLGAHFSAFDGGR